MARRTFPLLLVASLGVACSSKAPGGAPFEVKGTPVRTTTVDLPRTLKFAPAIIEVSAGTTVTWTNHDVLDHTVRLLSGSKPDRPLKLGETIRITFPTAGTIYYDCSIHPQMHGKVIVDP
jgi:plastocyanin